MLYLRWWNHIKTNHQSRCIGDGFKPPKGAVVNSYGIERLGKVNPRDYQVLIKELNESEPLMRCREVGTISQKLRSMLRS